MTGTACGKSAPAAYRAGDTVVGVLRRRAGLEGERTAFRFVREGEANEAAISYTDLDRRARAVAAVLQQRQRAGDRTLLVHPPGLPLIAAFLGCLYARTVPVLVPPPAPSRLGAFLAKASGIARDATPTLALTTATVGRQVAGAELPDELGRLPWEITDPAPEDASADRVDSDAGGHEVAYLQYTSGSTSEPRGVVVSHGNLMANLRAIERTFAQPPGTESVCWLPPYHDMGLVGGILAPLYLGTAATLLTPLDFIQRPLRWLSAIARRRAVVSGGPTFAYELCARRVRREELDGLDLRCWRVAFCGAEPVEPATLRRFAQHFEPCGFDPAAFKPCYGLAEGTLLVATPAAGARPGVRPFRAAALVRGAAAVAAETDGDARLLASCGPAVESVAVVDPATGRPCDAGTIGEIWVSGPSVARGYWRRPAETAAVFRAELAGASEPGYLRTGDLGFLLDGELFVTGRLKDLIIVDGANHYPQDLERTATRAHPALDAAEAAAFPIPVDGREGVVVALAPGRRAAAPADELRRAVRAAIAVAHDIRLHEVVLVRTGGLPKTGSGKLRRSRCRMEYLAGGLEPWERA
jgi:acyl-CoA synthetase (AMP-forming)/AMP-acid ligase II